MPPDDGRPAGALRSLVIRVALSAARFRVVTLALAGALVVLSAWRVAKLELRTNLHELLPASDPAVVVLREMNRRMPSLSSVVVVVQGPDPAANRRFVDDLVPRLHALPSPVIDEVVWGARDEIDFFHRHRFLYAGLDDLEQAAATLEQEIARRRNPLLVDLGDEGGAEALRARLKELEKKGQALAGRYPDGYFAYADRTLYAVVVWLRSSLLGDAAGERTVEQIREAVRALDSSRYDRRMTVGLTGNLITQKEEHDALANDLKIATTVCVALVCLSLLLFYDRLWAVPLAAVPAFVGVAMALAFAERAFGYLNSSTAFMGSIIVGNGINYAIVQMARYEEERRRGLPVREATAVAVGATWRGTALAAAGAAIAYGSLVITSFRGFNQFGYIGGLGMMLCWLATITVLPALWALLDRDESAPPPGRRRFGLSEPFGRFVARRPGPLCAVAGVLTVLSLTPLPRYARDPFEYDFEKLRSQRARFAEGERLSGALNPIFGRTMSPNFILAKEPGQVEEIRRKMRERDKKLGVLGEVHTINDYLPGDAKTQARKLELLGRIRRLIDRNADLVEGEERERLLSLRPPEELRPLRPEDLPRSIRRFFTESDGTIGRVVVYQLREDISVWDGRNQLKLAQVVQDLRLDSGERIRSSGSAMIFAGMLRAIVEEGPVVTVVALVAVILAVFLFTREHGGALLVLASLVLGVLWMLGATAWAGVRVNFLNFIALPITFGIGAEYGINLHQRYALEGRGRVAQSVATTGSAVALCSLTTIIGYAALLVADSHALRSFGALAILGEVTCLATGVVLLPAWLVLRERRARRGQDAAPADDQDPGARA